MYLLFPFSVVVLCFLIFLCYFKVKAPNNEESFSSWIMLNPSQGLMVQPSLWLAIILPFLLFLVFGFFAWSGHSVSFTSEGFNLFISISKLPLGILAISLPLSALIIRIHSTHQTALQIETTSYKNRQDEYYAHESSLHSYFTRIEPLKLIGFEGEYSLSIDNRLYRKIYPKNSPHTGVTEHNHLFTSMLTGKMMELGKQIYYINTYSDNRKQLDLVANTLFLAIKNMNQICNALFVEVPCSLNSTEWLKVDNGSVALKSKNVDELVGQYRYLYIYMINLLSYVHVELGLIDRRVNHLLHDPMYYEIRRPELFLSIYTNGQHTTYPLVKFKMPAQ